MSLLALACLTFSACRAADDDLLRAFRFGGGSRATQKLAVHRAQPQQQIDFTRALRPLHSPFLSEAYALSKNSPHLYPILLDIVNLSSQSGGLPSASLAAGYITTRIVFQKAITTASRAMPTVSLENGIKTMLGIPAEKSLKLNARSLVAKYTEALASDDEELMRLFLGQSLYFAAQNSFNILPHLILHHLFMRTAPRIQRLNYNLYQQGRSETLVHLLGGVLAYNARVRAESSWTYQRNLFIATHVAPHLTKAILNVAKINREPSAREIEWCAHFLTEKVIPLLRK